MKREKKIFQTEVSVIPSMIMVTNNIPDKVETDIEYDPRFKLWRITIDKK